MKKLMILAMVLGMASLASAGLSLDITTDSEVSASSTGVDGYVAWVSWTSSLTTTSYGTTAAAGGLAFLEDVYGVNPGTAFNLPQVGDSVYIVKFGTGSVTGDYAPGKHLTVAFAGDLTFGTAVTTLGRVDFISEDMTTVIDTVYVQAATPEVPEPMTMALLGLGGLFLRRRK